MNTEDTNKYYAVLELPSDASFSDVKKKYQHLKTFYSGDSMELDALDGDAPFQKKQSILAELDHAYDRLKYLLGCQEPMQQLPDRLPVDMSDDIKDYLSSVTAFSGPVLKDIRERMGIALEDISAVTKIQKRYLEEIEAEQFLSIRAEVYLRGYVIEYARYLSLDPQKVAADYIKRYRLFETLTKKTK